MKFCIPVPCFFSKTDFCDAIRQISALGFEYAETYQWKELDLDAVKRTLDETGVTLLSMCTTEFRMTDVTYRDAWLDGLKETLEAAAKLGVKKLITQVGDDIGIAREKQHEAIVETLIRATPLLEAYDVTMMPEPLNTYVDHPGYYLTTSKEGFDIIREVGHKNVKLIYDIYHQQIMEGNIIPNVVNNLDLIAHLHAAGHPGRHELEFGENDYKVIFDHIDKAGYTGACGLEYRPTKDSVKSLEDFKKIYRNNM